MGKVIGREQEVNVLESILSSTKAQFLALYGRRRIGKTHLIENFFSDKGLYFSITGLKDGSMQKQLEIFTKGFSQCFYDGIQIATPENWTNAFASLTDKILSHKKSEPIIIFFDELPWLATKRSGFLQTLDHYWNTQWCDIKNLKLIVCGSAGAWMLEKIIHDKGGLHNRLTRKILLQPFNLQQTKAYFLSKKFKISNKHIIDYYMVTGGVAFYLEFLQHSLSVVQNIQQLCFSQNAILQDEFSQIFRSLFDHSEVHMKIIKAMANKPYGITRDEIITATKIPSGGHLNKKLLELEVAGFVRGYTPFGKEKKYKYYRIIDEYSLFYLQWIAPFLTSGFEFPKNYWHQITNTAAWNNWAGYSFEILCLKHVHQIQHVLKLDNIIAMPSGWRYVAKKGTTDKGAQIDLLLDRSDDAITLFEIKYSRNQYRLDKNEARNIDNKIETFRRITKTKKQIFVTLITVNGVKQSLWLDDVVNSVITATDFFINE